MAGRILLMLAFISMLPAVYPSFENNHPAGATYLELAGPSGLDFYHFTGATGHFFLPEIMGPGAALFDYDQDGDLDVFLTQGKLLDPEAELSAARPAPAAGLPLTYRLFRNELNPGSELRFTDVTAQSGVGQSEYGMGVAVGDYDNDDDLDLYVTAFGPNVFYRNNGDGTFSDITDTAGVQDTRWSTSAAFLDYDRDGDLDLIVLNYIDFTVAGNKTCYDSLGALDYCNPSEYRPLPDRLFRNEGNGSFKDVTEETGLGAHFGPGLGVVCADFNLDNWPDIYVANDGTENQLWINRQDGTFEETALMSGAAFNSEGAPEGSMGLTSGDFDNDGDEDLFMTHLTRETNTLYLNDGRANFNDLTTQTGLGLASYAFTGFGTEWLDYDNDGYLDLYIANGAVTHIASLIGQDYPYHQKNQLFRNLGTGKFEEVSDVAGPALQLSEVSRGTAVGDIDNDGDLDILVSNNQGPVRLLINQVGNRKPWLQVRLQGVQDNRHGIGARVAVSISQTRRIWRRVHSDGSYLSANDQRVHVGLDQNRSSRVSVTVDWLRGESEIWSDLQPNQLITLIQGTGRPLKAAENESHSDTTKSQRSF